MNCIGTISIATMALIENEFVAQRLKSFIYSIFQFANCFPSPVQASRLNAKRFKRLRLSEYTILKGNRFYRENAAPEC